MANKRTKGEAHGDGAMTFHDIGKALGITGGGAWMLYKSAMRKLRRRRNSALLAKMLDLTKDRGRV